MGFSLQLGVFFLLLSLNLILGCPDGNCRILAFPAPFFFADKRLVNHTIRNKDGVDFDSCQFLCYQESNCVSINYEPNTQICELNNATHRGHDKEFVDKSGYFYHGADSACDELRCKNGGTCQSGFTDKLYRCLCPSGFTGEQCEIDDDECKASPSVCDANANCQNTVGSYTCSCNVGFSGDGKTCNDIDECAERSHDCLPSFASCVNTAGSYKCACNHGYVGDGKTSCVAQECQNYQSLSNEDRKVLYRRKDQKCDSKLGPGWFRFEGAAGTRMASSCPPIYRCGTDLTGWMNGAHPTVADGKVNRTVCFHWEGECCKYSTNIQVRNCSFYYVYYLSRTICHARYCSSD